MESNMEKCQSWYTVKFDFYLNYSSKEVMKFLFLQLGTNMTLAAGGHGTETWNSRKTQCHALFACALAIFPS